MNARPLHPDFYSAEEVARLLDLQPLEHEGGYFRRTAQAALPANGSLRAWSVIYFLVTPTGFSAMHQLTTDEIWCFHAGDPLESLRIAPDRSAEIVRLGADPATGERLQDVVRAGIWQGTRLRPSGRWALGTCVVAPEFRWSDFVLGRRDALTALCPAQAEMIAALTR